MKEKNKFIQMSKPYLDECELDSIRKVFETGYLGMGSCVEEFEQMLKVMFGREVVCVSSCTAALHLSLQAIGIKPGDEIIVQSLTYTATYQAITAAGAIPVSCDICENDLSIDLLDAKKKITPRTKAIIPVHYSGYATKLNDLFRFGAENNIRVIEDAAHAFGSKSNNALIGSAGDITCFSFDPVKNITCGDGGAILTDDRDIIKSVKEARFIGIEKSKSDGSVKTGVEYGEAVRLGWRYHMSNINAAIGISQLKKYPYIKKRRQEIAKRYMKNFEQFNSLELFDYDFNEIVPYIYVIKLKYKTNDEVMNELSRFGIQAGFHYYPCHLQKYFSTLFPASLPVTERIYKKLLTLPIHPGLELSDIDYITECLDRILN